MAGEIVHDDDVTGLQLEEEHLADVSLEPVAVDRSVETTISAIILLILSPATSIVVLR